MQNNKKDVLCKCQYDFVGFPTFLFCLFPTLLFCHLQNGYICCLDIETYNVEKLVYAPKTKVINIHFEGKKLCYLDEDMNWYYYNFETKEHILINDARKDLYFDNYK